MATLNQSPSICLFEPDQDIMKLSGPSSGLKPPASGNAELPPSLQHRDFSLCRQAPDIIWAPHSWTRCTALLVDLSAMHSKQWLKPVAVGTSLSAACQNSGQELVSRCLADNQTQVRMASKISATSIYIQILSIY